MVAFTEAETIMSKRGNAVKVQAFVVQYRAEGADAKTPVMLKPMWIFAKDDVFKAWKKEVRDSKVIEPRDF